MDTDSDSWPTPILGTNDVSRYGSINVVGRSTSFDDRHRPRLPSCSSVVSTNLHVYKRRWYILVVFAMFAFMQGALLNVWTVIASSAKAAFNWDDGTLQLMQTWIYVPYLIIMFPFAWLMDKKGLRIAAILSSLIMMIGTALRCISTTPPYVTWLAHIGHFVVGLAGPLAFSAGPTLSAMWFPPEQRTTATAISTIAGFAGAAGCFLFGPSMVEDPIPAPIVPPGNESYTNLDVIKKEILMCRYIECGICAAIFIAILIYFPSRPPSCPSISAAGGKLEFKEGMKDLFRKHNANFWLVCFAYCSSVSIYGVWSGLFGVILQNLPLSEKEIGWLGCAAVSAGCIAAVVFGRITDVFVGHMKVFLLVLNVCCILCTFWFVLVAQGYVGFSKVSLFAAAVLQCLCNNGAIPLYYEMAIETTYPVAEVCTSMAMTFVYNTLPLIFLLIIYVTSAVGGANWMNWCLYGALILSFPLLLRFREQYRRLMVDKGRADAPATLQQSLEIDVSGDANGTSALIA